MDPASFKDLLVKTIFRLNRHCEPGEEFKAEIIQLETLYYFFDHLHSVTNHASTQ